jgi:hypothetical protein
MTPIKLFSKGNNKNVKTRSYTVKQKFVHAITILLILAIALGPAASPTSALGQADKCSTPGNKVDRSFWEQVIPKLDPVPQNVDLAVKAFQLWLPYENTIACWNPLATTKKMPRSTKFNGANVQNFPDKATGAKATAQTLNLGYYKAIRQMLAQKSFDEAGIKKALKTWIGNASYADSLTKKWKKLYQPQTPNPSSNQPSTSSSNLPSDPLNPTMSPLISIPTPDGMEYFCIKVVDKKNGAQIKITECNGDAKEQQWKFVAKGNQYQIASQYSNKCLDVPKSHTKENGTLIQQWDCNGNANQLWTIVSKPSGYWIKSSTGMCLDVKDGVFSSGTLIQIWKCTEGNANQLWSSPGR